MASASIPWTLERLRGNVDVDGRGCWTWRGARCGRGYGRVKQKGRTIAAHRLAWDLATGEGASRGKWICHHCDNPPCCNPEHLYAGDARSNARDMFRRLRHPSVNGYGIPFADLVDIYTLRAFGASVASLAAAYGGCEAAIVRVCDPVVFSNCVELGWS